MASITLEYDYGDVNTQKMLEYVLSLGLFKPAVTGKNEETVFEKRKKLGEMLKKASKDCEVSSREVVKEFEMIDEYDF
jgi:hypothetical protein